MKTASPALINLLNTSQQFAMADLYTFTLASGTVYRYTNADIDITLDGFQYASLGAPLISRTATKSVRGVEVDTLTLNIAASTNHKIEGIPFHVAILKDGLLDGARIQLSRAFAASWTETFAGALILFAGRVSNVQGNRSDLKITVKSEIELLNLLLPRNLFQASCTHTLYDVGCGIKRDNCKTTGTVQSATTTSMQSNNRQPHGHFSQGVIMFTSGPHAGVKRTVKSYADGAFAFTPPLATPPSAGSTFQAWPGCNKTSNTCQRRFGNIVHFRGFPFVPSPETAL